MGLSFLTVFLFFLPFIGLMPQSGSLEPLENHELKMLKELAQAYDEIMEWVRPAAAAGLVFRDRDLKAAREVANRVEEHTFLAKEPVERQAIYAELASGTPQEDHDPGSQRD
ncbi:hypothetical protein TB15x_20760 [Xanthomonas perforans]|nr:hypothetical protein TB15x_20760 [Xanthomonas perforans]